MEARQKPGASSNGVSASPTVDMCAFRVCGQVGPPRRLPVAPAAPRRNSGRAAVHLSGLWTGGTRLGLAVPARGTPCARASWGDSSPVAPWGQPVTPRGRPATREAVHNSTGCTPRPTRLRRGRANGPSRVVRQRGGLLVSPLPSTHGSPWCPPFPSAAPRCNSGRAAVHLSGLWTGRGRPDARRTRPRPALRTRFLGWRPARDAPGVPGHAGGRPQLGRMHAAARVVAPGLFSSLAEPT